MHTTPGDWYCDLGLGGVGVAGIWCQLILFWEVILRVLRSGGFFVDVEKAMPRRRGTLREPRRQQDEGHALATVDWLVDGGHMAVVTGQSDCDEAQDVGYEIGIDRFEDDAQVDKHDVARYILYFSFGLDFGRGKTKDKDTGYTHRRATWGTLISTERHSPRWARRRVGNAAVAGRQQHVARVARRGAGHEQSIVTTSRTKVIL